MYYRERGVPKDYQKAMQYLVKSFDQGNEVAYSKIGSGSSSNFFFL